MGKSGKNDFEGQQSSFFDGLVTSSKAVSMSRAHMVA
jgi:hypothetical protein